MKTKERLSANYLDLSYARTHNILGKRVVRRMKDACEVQGMRTLKGHKNLYLFLTKHTQCEKDD